MSAAPALLQDITPLISIVISAVAVAIAGLAYRRTILNEAPVVELIADAENRHDPGRYLIHVDNPMRRFLYLDRIEILQPEPNHVAIWHRASEAGDTVRRIDDQLHPGSGPGTAAFLCVPPRQQQDLCVAIETAPVSATHFKLHWSGNLPHPTRCFITREIHADAGRLKSMRLSADTAAAARCS